jgi:hypothetical protein
VFGGAEAVVQIARRIWWSWPLFALSRLPGVMTLFDKLYARIAANRYCADGNCEVQKPSESVIDRLPLLLLPTATLFLRDVVPTWVFMWLLAGALFFGCKWLTWRRAIPNKVFSKVLSVGYLFAWAGMDAEEFLREKRVVEKPKSIDWFRATIKTLVGAMLMLVAAHSFSFLHPLAVGWLGMVGIILFLHFGSFELLALAWQRAGVKARPIMCTPWRATSLADFWRRRWNAAFHLLAHDLAFRPLLRKCGVVGATLIVFLISGLIHDLVISFPARGGYGLPTAYFLIQGLGVLAERTPIARRFGLGRGGRGWLFTMTVTAGPAFWLFHPIFVRNIILPMLHALGAT